MHLSIQKSASICHLMLCEVILTHAVEHICLKVSFIVASVLPHEVTFTLLNVKDEVASETATCGLPDFCATAV